MSQNKMVLSWRKLYLLLRKMNFLHILRQLKEIDQTGRSRKKLLKFFFQVEDATKCRIFNLKEKLVGAGGFSK